MLKIWLFIRLMFFGLLIITLFPSCEDVINVNLKNAAPRLVVEGNINNLVDSVNLFLHKSTDYFNPAEIASVTNATVTITDSYGNSYLLANKDSGKYSIGNFHVMPDNRYTLSILTDGIQFTASAEMPYLVNIDSLIIQNRPDHQQESQIVIYIKDPEGIANYYQVKIYKNDTLLNNGNNYVLFNDKYFDGKSTTITINTRRFGIPHFEVNDTVKVQLINIEKTMYDYYQVLRDITEGEAFLSASTPSNPPNNLNNGALGYFAVFAISEKTWVMK